MIEEGRNSKKEKQKKKKANWFRLLSQYAVMGRRKSLVINEPSEELDKNWQMVNNEKINIPIQVVEEVLNETSNIRGIGEALIHLSN